LSERKFVIEGLAKGVRLGSNVLRLFIELFGFWNTTVVHLL